MNRPAIAALAAWVVLGMPGISLGVNETPGSTDACQFEPSAWTLNTPREVLDNFWRVAHHESPDGQGYYVRQFLQMDESLTPEVTLVDFKSELAQRNGLFSIASHGREDRLYVELYPGTSEGKDSMEAAYWRYWYDSFMCNDCFIWGGGPTDGYYGIGVTPVGIETWYRSANSIVYAISCSGHSYSGQWLGARDVLGYDYDVEVDVAEYEAGLFWERMNGEQGKGFRDVESAAGGLNLIHCGVGATVLSPTVVSYHPYETTPIGQDSVPGWAVFDTWMDLGVNPSMVVHGNGNLKVMNERWRRGSKDTLKYTLKSVDVGAGAIFINSYAYSEGGVSLDGNQEPDGTDGVGPNRDYYVIAYECTSGSGNPAARVESQWAWRNETGVVVGWHAVAEWNTKCYTVEAGDGVSWVVVGAVSRGDVVSPGVYEVLVPDGYKFYRVVELDKTGSRCEFRRVSVPAAGGHSLAGMIQAAGLSKEPNRQEAVHPEDLCERESEARSKPVNTLVNVPDWVFYGPDSLLAETGPAVSWLESKGLAVDTVWAPSPDP